MLIALLKTTRPPFLLLTVVIVALAAGLAKNQGFMVSTLMLSFVFVSAICSHACVNVLNEVHDARSGLDNLTQRTPFSGGSGALQEQPHLLRAASRLGRALLLIVIAMGGYFIYLRGWTLLPLGLAGLGLVGAYTPILTRRPWLCLIAPGLGFGPLMLLGGYVVITGEYSWLVLAVSLIPLLLVSNLLLLNQFPDAQADTQVGRNNVLTAYGPNTAIKIFLSFLVAAFIMLLLLVALDLLPLMALLGGLALVAALPLYFAVADATQFHTISHRLLGLNVAVTMGVPLLIAVGLAVS